MDKGSDGESRLHRYAQAFRRDANPPANLAATLMEGLGTPPRHRLGLVPAFALAAGVLVAGLVIGFGALQLRGLGHPSPTPPIRIATPTPSSTPAPSATPSATATRSPAPTPTPTQAAGGPMEVLDLSFVDPSHGWAIGSICLQPSDCRLQLRITSDGGRTWSPKKAPAEQALGNEVGWQIRFDNVNDGWLYGPRLYATHDGGLTWKDVGPSHVTLSLASSGPSVWAVEADCQQGSCGGLALYMSADFGRTWGRAAAQPFIAGHAAQLVRVSDTTGWLLSWSQDGVQPPPYQSGLAVTHDGGRTWQKLVTPCAPETSLEDRAAALSDGTIWVVCGGDLAQGHEQKQVIVSHDGGLHWNFPPDAPLQGFNRELALSGDSKAWLAAEYGGLYQTINGGATWQTSDARGVAIPPNAPGVTRVQFIDSQHGWAAGSHDIFWTSDGGAHWGHTGI